MVARSASEARSEAEGRTEDVDWGLGREGTEQEPERGVRDRIRTEKQDVSIPKNPSNSAHRKDAQGSSGHSADDLYTACLRLSIANAERFNITQKRAAKGRMNDVALNAISVGTTLLRIRWSRQEYRKHNGSLNYCFLYPYPEEPDPDPKWFSV